MQPSALFEAEQLIQSWLRDDSDYTAPIRHDSPPATLDLDTVAGHTYRRPLQWSRSGMGTAPLSSHSVPNLPSFDALSWKYSALRDSLSTVSLLPPSTLPPSATHYHTHAAGLNSKSDIWTGGSSSHNTKKKDSPSMHLDPWKSHPARISHTELNMNLKSNVSRCAAESDPLPGQDWGEGDVRENVSSIVEALMKKPVSSRGGGRRENGERRGGAGECSDPRVTMEMRHKQVRDRRRVRDEARRRSVKQCQRQREAWQEAERLVREGEREEGRRRRREESAVAEQMAVIRRQVREETERKRRDRLVGMATGKPHPSRVLGISGREAVMRCAGECVRSEERERRRRENKVELLKQLEEVEIAERKERSKVLRHAVSVWYGMVTEQRAKMRRAAAWRAWHVLGRVWGVWRRYVRERREVREQNRVAREMQRQKRLIVMAMKHYHHRLLRQCVCGWLVEVGRERGRRERETEGRKQRERVQAFLTAAAQSTVAAASEEEGGERVRESVVTPGKAVAGREKRGGVPDKTTAQLTVWQTARKHVDGLLAAVAPPTTTTEGEESSDKDHTHPVMSSRDVNESVMEVPVGGDGGRGEEVVRSEGGRGEGGREGRGKDGKPFTCTSPAVWPPHPQSKPVTKPIPMSGMQARTEAIAERKRKREERERERVREREERARREEEEKREKEIQEREAIAAKHREGRKLAKQRERERMERQKREKEQTTRAVEHYTISLLHSRGLGPWQRFVVEMRRQWKRAEQFHLHWRLQHGLGKWRELVTRRLGQRQQAADDLYHMILRRRVWRGWREYVRECQCMEAACEGWSRDLLCRAVFRAWLRATTTGRREEWERERRAKMHHVRQLKRRVLTSWKHYVPLSQEEREREVRRAGLRRKVTQWLPDYHPQDFDKGDDIMTI